MLTKLPYKWRNALFILFVGALFFLLYTYHENIFPSAYSTDPLSHSTANSRFRQQTPFTQKFTKKRIYGLDNFDSSLPKLQIAFEKETGEEKNTRQLRQTAVKNSFLYGWNGYKTFAMGADELKPLSNEPNNNFGGLGAMIIDSISTMLVMELDEVFDEVLPLIEKIDFKVDDYLSVFETTIRCLGGLLSSYELSSHPNRHILLDKAEELGMVLLPAFDTRFGIPYHKYNPVEGAGFSNSTYLADAGTIQLEFFTLTHYTGNPIFAEKAQAVIDFFDAAEYTHGVQFPGLFPTTLEVHEGYFSRSAISFGAMGDSAYEYLLKEYMLSDGKVPQYARMYLTAIDSMKHNMLTQIPGYKFLFLPTYEPDLNDRGTTMDHLTCFAPGMLAIGAKLFNRPDDLKVAKGLLETCIHMYRATPTNLSPESLTFEFTVPYNPLTYGMTKEEIETSHIWWQPRRRKGGRIRPLLINTMPRPEQHTEVPNRTNRTLEDAIQSPENVFAYDYRYLLRPETVESLLIMYRITGDPRYQEYGWEIYQAIEKHCKTDTAYASIKNVLAKKTNKVDNQIDSMETFLFAETFKYLYLLFSEPGVISLDKFIFNTEAHPLLRRPWELNIQRA